MNIAELQKKALQNYNQGNDKEALKYANLILYDYPKDCTAMIIKGNVLYRQGKFDDALDWYTQAVAIEPDNKIAWINSANVCNTKKDYNFAYKSAKRALAIDADDSNALTLCGNSAIELEKYDEAKEIFLRLVENDSSDFWSYNSLSQIYEKTQDYEQALSTGLKAVELSGGDKKQQLNFGYMLYEISQNGAEETAQKYAQEWLDKYPRDPIVYHMANAVLRNGGIERASVSYVRAVFDEFAGDFENVLDGLAYKVPQLISEELVKVYGIAKKTKLQILDAGCGTGLCGPILKQYAGFWGLHGLDISAKMLEVAAEKKVYDKLINQDLEKYLSVTKNKYDLIVAADVLTYFGDLSKILSGCAIALHKKGRILFSITKNDIDESNYILHPSGRFLHTKSYIEKELSENGFSVLEIKENVLRLEGEKEVIGFLIDAVKTA